MEYSLYKSMNILRNPKVYTILIALLFGYSISYQLHLSGVLFVLSMTCSVVLLWVVTLLALCCIVYFNLVRQIHNNNSGSLKREMVITDIGVTIEINKHVRFVDWKEVSQLKKLRTCIYLQQGQEFLVVIPNRTFVSIEQKDIFFRNLLESYVRRKTD